jgi:uncharacterized membrane protein (DUF4010 family)
MTVVELFQRLALALAIGLLVGIERGWQERKDPDGSRTAGIRTYALVGLLGGVWAAMTPKLGPVPLAAASIAFAAAFTLFEFREASAKGQFSVTGTVAGLLVFALGAYAVLGEMELAAAAGAATVGLLLARQNLHEFLRKLTWPELRSGVLLLAMTFVLLPVLPNRPIDPFNAFNPFELWMMTVSIAALSFAGYVAVRALGQRKGLIVGAAAGSLVSSTAVTLNNTRLAAQNKTDANDAFAVPICVAWMVSLTRMIVIATALNPDLFPSLAGPISAALLVLCGATIYFNRKAAREHSHPNVELHNPFDLDWVLGFGALLSVVTVGSKILITLFGEAGLLLMAGVSGFVDVDPVTLSAARLAGASVTVREAATAILLAAGANLITKMTVPVLVGGRKFGLRLAATGVLVLIAGAAAFFFTGVK